MQPTNSFVKRHPLLAFFVLTYVISWAPALMLAVNPKFPLPIFAAGPSVAALIVAAIAEGRTGLRDLFSRSLRWRVGLRWYAVALFAPIPFFVAAVYLNVLLGAPALTLAQLAAWPSLFGIFATYLLIPLRGSYEEFGWRGYALPKLLAGQSALWASLILGTFWAIWHVPIFITGQIHWSAALAILPQAVIYTWLFNRTQGSALLAFLFHASLDTVSDFVFMTFSYSGADQVRLYWMMAAMSVIWALGLIFVTGRNLAQRPMARVATVAAGQPLVSK